MILDYKNSKIHYRVSGKGEALILLHGFLENVDMWNDFVPELSKTKKVISIDLLGHGKTECLGYVHTMEDMADAVLAVINNLKIEKATFIGHSMGGYVALALAAKHPELFSGLCLMNSTFEADDKDRQAIRDRGIKMAQSNYESLVRISFANLFAPSSKSKFKAAFENGLSLALKTTVQGYIAAQEGMKVRLNRFEILKTLNCKRLIIVGEKDNLVDLEKIKNKIKDTAIKLEVLPEGHMSHIENKSELSYLLRRFNEK